VVKRWVREDNPIQYVGCLSSYGLKKILPDDGCRLAFDIGYVPHLQGAVENLRKMEWPSKM